MSKCSKLTQKDYNTRHDWVGKVIHWELSKKSKFNHTSKWYVQTRIRPGKWHVQTSLGFWDTNGTPNFSQMTRLGDSEKKGTCQRVDIAVPADHKVKLKESEMRDKYLDLARELWNMKVTVIPIGIQKLLQTLFFSFLFLRMN